MSLFRYSLFAIACLLLFGNPLLFSQQKMDVTELKNKTQTERLSHLLEFPFANLDSTAFEENWRSLLHLAEAEKDHRSQFALKFIRCYVAPKRLPQEEEFRQLDEMEKIALENRLPVEQAVAFHYKTMAEFYAGKKAFEPTYVKVLQSYRQFEETGFEKFAPYPLEKMLYRLGKFMFDVEDFEQALKFLNVAEGFIHPTEKGWRNYILVLNTIQSIHQRQKNYQKGIEYAQKILRFAQSFQSSDLDALKNCRTWQGISSIDIASMLTAQGNFAEGEAYANRGYELAKATDEGSMTAEYDALQVLVPTKLELGKIAEAGSLLQRMEVIFKSARLSDFDYFKGIGLFESYARWHEIKGDYAAALRYANLAKPLKDSLERRNDARKYEKIKQRLDAEKYTEQLRLVESENQLQTWLRNAALLILALVVVVALLNYRRLQAKRRLALAELEAARTELAAYTNSFREKSEMVENLRQEMEKLSAKGERSQYLEQLTSSTILTEDDWVQFRSVFEKVHPDFIAEQKSLHPDLTQAELRYLVLEKLQLTTHEMANMLGVSDGTIRQTRMRLRRKIG